MQVKSALRVLLIRALLWAGGAASSSVPLCRLVSELTGDSELKTLSETALVSPGSCIEYKATRLRSCSMRQHMSVPRHQGDAQQGCRVPGSVGNQPYKRGKPRILT